MPINIGTRNSTHNTSDAILCWTVHLASDYPSKTIISLIGIAVACITAYFTIGNMIASLIIGIALIASLADFLFPIRYIITSQSAICLMPFKKAEIRWSDVKRCYLDNMGVKLSPFDRTSRLEAFRGVFLRFSDNKEQVIEVVRSLKEIN